MLAWQADERLVSYLGSPDSISRDWPQRRVAWPSLALRVLEEQPDRPAGDRLRWQGRFAVDVFSRDLDVASAISQWLIDRWSIPWSRPEGLMLPRWMVTRLAWQRTQPLSPSRTLNTDQTLFRMTLLGELRALRSHATES